MDKEQIIMRPGDRFVAHECGCAFTVDTGPRDESMATEAPRCCCGHAMVKTGDRDPSDADANGAPAAMAD